MVRVARFQDDAGVVCTGIAHADGSVTYANGSIFDGSLQDTGRAAKVSQLLAPVQPPVVMCIGLNYRKHADELKLPYPKNPVVFLKPPNTVCGPGVPIVKPRITEKMDYEVELAVVIGKPCKDVSVDEALHYIAGYTCANDISTRDWQKVPELSGGQWTRSKIFDNFCPLGPVLVTADEIPDPNKLRVQTFVNGEKMQDSSTTDLIFNIQQVVSFCSIGTTLAPGTVIITGTPAGVAEGRSPQPWLKPGDHCVVEIEKIGRLENSIAADPSSTGCFHVKSKL
jgi:2-keto-4-pentenoate hydratase/2-oxohepta-3-ene-1,7-dioic acid hydratase in catechol pathway